MAEIQGRLHRSKNVRDNKGSLWNIPICLSVAVMLILVLGACAEPTPTVDVAQYVDATLTSVAATSEAAVTPTPTLTSTPALTPTSTLTQTPTRTSTPCPTPTLSIYEQIPPRGDYDHGSIEVTEEYDRFSDFTFVNLTSEVGWMYGPEDGLYVICGYDGTSPSIPLFVEIGFQSSSDDWDYLDCHSVYFLIDDSIRLHPDTEHDGTVGNGWVLEMVSMYLDTSDFLKIVNAEKVEVSLCNDEFTLTDNQMEALRDAASRMRE